MKEPSATGPATSDGLWRWLVGGLTAGAVVLGLLVAAYAVGYHHGRDQTRDATERTSPAVATAPTTTATTVPRTAPSTAPVPVTAALVARGKSLFERDGCSSCHALSGDAGVGPSLKGVTGSRVTLATGETVTADDAYLERSISDPDAQVVKGYRGGMMPGAIASYDLAGKPSDLRALVAFIKSQK